MCITCFVQDVTHVISLGVVFFPCHQLNICACNAHALEWSASKVPDQPSIALRAYQMTRRQTNLLPGTALREVQLWLIKANAWLHAP